MTERKHRGNAARPYLNRHKRYARLKVMVSRTKQSNGFTIVELLIVVVVIAILAAITIVAYNGVQERTRESSVKNAVQQAHKKILSTKVTTNAQPVSLASIGVTDTSTVTFGYTLLNNNTESCVWAQSGSKTFSLQEGSEMVEGDCGQVVASYYVGHSFTSPAFSRSETQMANNWGAGSPDARIPADVFAAKYRARVIPPETGAYTFYTNTDDNAELIVNGQTVIPWTSAGVRDASSTSVSLVAGVPVQVEYSMREQGGNAYATLSWSYGSQARMTVPASAYLRP